jgi:hypothetical protein
VSQTVETHPELVDTPGESQQVESQQVEKEAFDGMVKRVETIQVAPSTGRTAKKGGWGGTSSDGVKLADQQAAQREARRQSTRGEGETHVGSSRAHSKHGPEG